MGTRTADNPEFVDAVARKSVELTVGRIRRGSPVIAELERSGAIKNRRVLLQLIHRCRRIPELKGERLRPSEVPRLA